MVEREHVTEILSQLDGSLESAVALMTGLSPERIQELGGITEAGDHA